MMSGGIDTSFIEEDSAGSPRTESESEGAIPTEELEQARDDIIQWAESLVKINGTRVDYQGDYRYWKEPLRAVVDPDTERIHIWKMARGQGKTVQSSIVEAHIPTTRQMHDIIHTVPRSDQLNSYMKRTMARMIETSRGDPPILEAMLEDNRVAVKRNKFRTGSFLEGRSAWGDGRSIQGFHGQFGTADEAQNWTTAALSNLKEAIDSGLARVLLTGTPDYEGTVYHEHWQESTQHMWHHTCPDCSTDQTITLDSVQVIDTNPKRWGLFCRQCQAELDQERIRLDGFWRATNPEGVHRGYTLNQLISPRHPLDEVMRSRELASTSKGEFYRFKLAQFYSGGAKPIPEAAIYSVCDDQIGLQARAVEGYGPYYAGIDWGGGESADTIVVICTVDERNKDHWPKGITIRNVERIEYEHRTEELRKAAQVLDRFQIGRDGRGMADLGYGTAHVDALQNGDKRDNPIPERGWGSHVSGHRFDLSATNDTDGKWPFLKRDGKTVHAAQAPWANRVFDLFPEVQGYDETPDSVEGGYDLSRTPDKRIRIPYQDEVETRDTMNYWFDHLTSIKRKFEELKSGNRKERITTFQSNQKDDGFYALLYAYTAACLGGKRGGYEPMNIRGGTA
jgi:hypothetical protein